MNSVNQASYFETFFSPTKALPNQVGEGSTTISEKSGSFFEEYLLTLQENDPLLEKEKNTGPMNSETKREAKVSKETIASRKNQDQEEEQEAPPSGVQKEEPYKSVERSEKQLTEQKPEVATRQNNQNAGNEDATNQKTKIHSKSSPKSSLILNSSKKVTLMDANSSLLEAKEGQWMVLRGRKVLPNQVTG